MNAAVLAASVPPAPLSPDAVPPGPGSGSGPGPGAGDVLPGRWRILAAILAGTIMGPIDASIVNINLPVIAGTFHASPDEVGWVSMAYLLVLGSLLLPFGRLGDMRGLRRVYLVGLALFVVTSASCALSWSLASLIMFRSLQALGAGMTMAMSPAIITALFPASERGRALGLNGMTVALGLSVGPSLGGWLAAGFGWRSIFLVNLPVGVVAWWLCHRMIPPLRTGVRGRQFDWKGATLAFLALAFLLVSATRGPATGWSPAFIVLGAGGLALSIAFVHLEGKSADPMLDISIFRSRVFSVAIAVALLNFVAQYVIVFVTPFYLQRVLNYTPARAGVVMTAFPLVVLVMAPFAGALSDRVGHRWPAFAGLALCALAAGTLFTLGRGSSAVGVAWRLGLFGLGTGLFQSPNNSAAMGSVPRPRLGTAGAILATARNVGMACGVALGSTLLAARHTAHLAAGTFDALSAAVREACLAASLVALVAALLQLCLVSVRIGH